MRDYMFYRLLAKRWIVISLVLLFFSLFVPQSFAQDSKNLVEVYYPNGDWSYSPLTVTVDGKDNLLEVLNLIVSPEELPDGYYNEFPKGLSISGYRIKGDTIYIAIDNTVLSTMDKNSYCVPLMEDIISYNVYKLNPDIFNIEFINEGNPREKFGNTNRSNSSNDTFIDVINAPLKVGFDFSQLEGKSEAEIAEIIRAEVEKRAGSIAPLYTTYKVCIDPGHGGSDPGAVTTYNGTSVYESNLNLSIALQAQTDLYRRVNPSFNVYMTRTSDVSVSYTTRCNIANNNSVKCFISVHNNISPSNPSARGCTALYPGTHHVSQSQSLATSIVSSIVSLTSLPKHRDPYQDSYAVLNGTTMPATIVECGFMSNSTDLPYLMNNASTIGHALGSGISNWCQLN